MKYSIAEMNTELKMKTSCITETEYMPLRKNLLSFIHLCGKKLKKETALLKDETVLAKTLYCLINIGVVKTLSLSTQTGENPRLSTTLTQRVVSPLLGGIRLMDYNIACMWCLYLLFCDKGILVFGEILGQVLV